MMILALELAGKNKLDRQTQGSRDGRRKEGTGRRISSKGEKKKLKLMNFF